MLVTVHKSTAQEWSLIAHGGPQHVAPYEMLMPPPLPALRLFLRMLCQVLDGFHDVDTTVAMADIYVWLRYSASRQLTWQRNYNTQPRILSAAQVSARAMAVWYMLE